MAAHARLEVLGRILEDGLMPTIQPGTSDGAIATIRALAAGGASVVELLQRGDGSFELFRAIVPTLRRDFPQLVVGVGSIVDAPTAALHLAQGADFVVGPNFDPRVARLCNRRKVAYLPGCGTPSEIANAEELGCEIVKLFPSSAMNGPEFVRSLRGPMPWSRVMPTGNGVAYAEASIREWIAAGACAVGMGGALVDPKLVAAGDFAALSDRVAQLLDWIRRARAK